MNQADHLFFVNLCILKVRKRKLTSRVRVFKMETLKSPFSNMDLCYEFLVSTTRSFKLMISCDKWILSSFSKWLSQKLFHQRRTLYLFWCLSSLKSLKSNMKSVGKSDTGYTHNKLELYLLYKNDKNYIYIKGVLYIRVFFFDLETVFFE